MLRRWAVVRAVEDCDGELLYEIPVALFFTRHRARKHRHLLIAHTLMGAITVRFEVRHLGRSTPQ